MKLDFMWKGAIRRNSDIEVDTTLISYFGNTVLLEAPLIYLLHSHNIISPNVFLIMRAFYVVVGTLLYSFTDVYSYIMIPMINNYALSYLYVLCTFTTTQYVVVTPNTWAVLFYINWEEVRIFRYNRHILYGWSERFPSFKLIGSPLFHTTRQFFDLLVLC